MGGIDSGKGHHHGLVLDADGKTLLSRRVANDEPELLKLTSWTWPTAVRSPGPST
ncbi:transposase [Streptomyces capillispiralis]|uniref:Transposase n=1 Tax=Streptomyces capillispiralis TaxID=68182 RepID=A0A561SGG6_9ACTN|nr:transposase [Streptomyces capillispiralis]